MRSTFLLPLARMLEAFYRAIKAINQSLLNDLWFLTCFTGSDTLVATHRTHGFTHCGLHNLWVLWLWKHFVTMLLHCWGLDKSYFLYHWCRLCWGQKRKEEKKVQAEEECRIRGIHWLAWDFSCPCIPVETYLRLFVLHTNSVLQGTYRQLMCFMLGIARAITRAVIYASRWSSLKCVFRVTASSVSRGVEKINTREILHKDLSEAHAAYRG